MISKLSTSPSIEEGLGLPSIYNRRAVAPDCGWGVRSVSSAGACAHPAGGDAQ